MVRSKTLKFLNVPSGVGNVITIEFPLDSVGISKRLKATSSSFTKLVCCGIILRSPCTSIFFCRNVLPKVIGGKTTYDS